MSTKLKEFIRAVRGCKTQAEERSLVQKECASIRNAFKAGKEHYRNRCMLKLLYVSMLGYPTEFGQVEVVKLIAQPMYTGKRIGYLTMAIVLDETSEVLTLAENHIKKDLADTNPYIQSLALDTVANISGEDMARDVLHEVQQLVDSSNVYLKKKACLAALRIVKKAPEHCETFIDRLKDVLTERNHGALLTSLSLVNECLRTEYAPSFLGLFRGQVPAAVRLLKQLVLSSKMSDNDVNGVSDPFLQVRLLQFMRLVGVGDRSSAESMNDVLAQVITNTDSSKNAGCSVLYEAVRTIIAIESEDSLRALAITTLGRFLTSTRDNNVRFVALGTLVHVMQRNPAEVQEHHATIVDCLKDSDYSIRRLALLLTVALIDDTNVRIVVPDLIVYLGACGEDAKEEVTKQLCTVILNKAPTPEWRIEMCLRLMKVGRQYTPDDFALEFIAHLSRSAPEVQEGAVKSLWEAASLPFDAQQQVKHAFLIAALWSLGEFPQFAVAAGAAPEMVLSTVATVLTNTTDTLLKQYGLTSMMKIASKYPNQTKAESIAVFENYASSLDCELQQRALEYITLLEEFPDLAAFSYGPMPPIEHVASEAELLTNVNVTVITQQEAQQQQPKPQFLDDLFGGPSVPVSGGGGHASSTPTSSAPHDLDNLFGGGPSASASPVTTSGTSKPPPRGGHDLDDLFGGGPKSVPSGGFGNIQGDDFGEFNNSSSPTPVEVYRNDKVIVSLLATRTSRTHGTLTIRSICNIPIYNTTVFIAVPKTSSVDVKPLSNTTIAPNASVTQSFDVTSPPEKVGSLMLRVKLEYVASGQESFIFQVSHEAK